MKDNPLTIIIPVRSEEDSILQTIASLQNAVRTPHTILIADDSVSKTDRTIEILKVMRNRSIGISLKPKSGADGFGPTLLRAIRKVHTPYTIFVMADMSDDAKTIDRMMSAIQKNPLDVVVGCRYIKGAKKIGGPMLQGVLSTFVNGFLFRIAGFPTRDSTNAFKLYRTEFLKHILPESPETGVEFSLQLIIQAVSHHGRMMDIPTVWRGREKGHSKVRLFSRGPKYMKLVVEALMNRVLRAPGMRGLFGRGKINE